ncbi:hypothetical protein VT91_09580 [Clostridium sporogenes]|nr:hypothetical protein WG71_15870 [Clostridium sporogenes]KRU33432.1 hypothetical protein VT91_09580 [Clostridium sporogenes]KRU33936.1 hypothetical protein VT28_04920 [Clostridium sporogenes]KRU43416.1 hypothetical protein VT95_16810 [Clostridium sporogenes]OQP88649.1 hypothetical protein VT92_0225900 [Clostridium sporogenes]
MIKLKYNICESGGIYMKKKIVKMVEECTDATKLDLILFFIEKLLKKG